MGSIGTGAGTDAAAGVGAAGVDPFGRGINTPVPSTGISSWAEYKCICRGGFAIIGTVYLEVSGSSSGTVDKHHLTLGRHLLIKQWFGGFNKRICATLTVTPINPTQEGSPPEEVTHNDEESAETSNRELTPAFGNSKKRNNGERAAHTKYQRFFRHGG